MSVNNVQDKLNNWAQSYSTIITDIRLVSSNLSLIIGMITPLPKSSGTKQCKLIILKSNVIQTINEGFVTVY